MSIFNRHVGLRRGALAPRSIFLILAAFIIASTALLGDQLPAQSLTIKVVEGDGAINNIKLRSNREVIVQVEDENHRPIAGATVSAFLPNTGASGTFAGGGQMFNGTSGNDGQIRFRFRPNNLQGKFQIRLTASFQGQNVAALVAQTNILSAVAVGGLSVAAKILIVVAVAAGAGAGGIALAHGGGGSSTSPAATPPAITIGSGTGSVVIGSPH